MTIKEIRTLTKMSQKAFSEFYKIPLRTLQSWEIGERKPPEYFIILLERVVKADYAETKKYKCPKCQGLGIIKIEDIETDCDLCKGIGYTEKEYKPIYEVSGYKAFE